MVHAHVHLTYLDVRVETGCGLSLQIISRQLARWRLVIML